MKLDSTENQPPNNTQPSASSSSSPAGAAPAAAGADKAKAFSSVNVKVVPKPLKKKIDYSKSYTANNFITTVRAFNEYLLKPT